MIGLLLLATALISAATIHDPPPVTLEAELSADRLFVHVFMKEEIYQNWLEHDPTRIPDLDDEETRALHDRVAEFLAREAPVRIDRVEVKPVVEYVEYQPGFEENDFLNYVAFEVAYGVKGVPRQVAFQWRRYDTGTGWPIEEWVGVIGYEGDYQELLFAPSEPEVVWHAPRSYDRQPRRVYSPPAPQELVLPLATLGLLAFALLLTIVFAWKPAPRWLSWPAVVLLCGVALAVAPVAQTRVPAPWTSRVPLPDEEEARYLFESLQRNIYRAFDYESESDIYDALARSLDDRLLDEVYGEIYQSLILEDDGGALCRIKGVKILESQIEYPDLDGVFRVRARWRVTGTVTHWGHTHWRTNEYDALYTVAGEGESWRITDVEVKDQQRLTTQSGATGL